MKDNNRITIRHPRKREFFSKLALAGETAQDILSGAIDNYLQEEKTMQLFTHFKDGLFISENTYRKPGYVSGEFEHIFEDDIVVDLSVDQIRDALCGGELLGKIDVTQEQVEETFSSLPDENENIRFNE